jgi:hypothetical protein
VSVVAKIETLEQVGQLHLKSYKPAEIARQLNITTREAKYYVEQYQELVRKRVEQDPEFLDRVGEHTLEALERLDNLVKEAWETYDTAKNNDMMNQQINLLKVASTLEQQRANLLQLMGAKMDGGMMARMQRAERVNDIVSRIIKDTASQCEICKPLIMPRLAEAFALMNRAEEAADMQPVDDDIEEAVIVEEEVDNSAMMDDVISYE